MIKIGYRVIKKLVPSFLKDIIRPAVYEIRLSREIKCDIKKIKKFSFELNKKNDIHNLFARLTFHIHAIEKGLSNQNFRKGFGQRALYSLEKAMTEYKNANFPLDEERFLSAIIVLQEYCKAHEYQPEYCSDIENFLKKFNIDPPNLLVGAVRHQKEEILTYSKSNFFDLALNRISVRDFSPTDVEDGLIFNSISIAMKSPSACNRHPWRVHYLKDTGILEKVLVLQGGLKGNGENLQKLLLVSVDLRYYLNVNERNQGYIDGGLFLMSLVYALTYNGVATCILHAMFNRKREDDIRKLLRLDESEILIAFIALGNYPDTFKAPASLRDSYDKCLTTH